MILTYSIYAILALLILIGFKFSGFKEFNDDFLDENVSKSIRGLAVILIIIHHISQRSAFQDVTRELYFFNGIGFLFVTIFFFNSGYGLTISAKNKPGYLDTFIKKRIPKIVIPFIVTNIIFSIYGFLNGMPLIRVLLGIFGIVNVNSNGWYPIVILIMYFVFYFAQKCLKKDSFRLLLYFVVTILLIVIFCVNGHFAWWAGKPGWWITSTGFTKASWWMQQGVLWFSGEWWVDSTIAFSVGAAFAMYKESIVSFFKKGYWIKLLICIVLFAVSYKLFYDANNNLHGYWTEFGSMKPEIGTKLLLSAYHLPTSLFFTLLIEVILMKFKTSNPITRFLGSISYETYLIGLIVLDAFNFLIFNGQTPIIKGPYNYNLAIYTVCVILGTILCGFILNKIDCLIVRKLNKK